MAANNFPAEKDIFRDSPMRYLGYSNEVGEALRPLIRKSLVNFSYGIAITYVCADAYDKSCKVYRRPINGGIKKTGIMASDVLIWQMLASVIIPGFTINRITWASGRLVQLSKLKKHKFAKILPTCCGLISIPFIIKPIDTAVDHAMDRTFRKWF